MIIFTGNFLPKDASLEGKSGAKYSKHGGFCAETQIYPDAINQIHQNKNFPDVVIRPGDVYTNTKFPTNSRLLELSILSIPLNATIK